MRLPLTLAIATLSTLAFADRLIEIPTARKVLFSNYRYEFSGEMQGNAGFENYLGLGIGKAFELDLRSIEPAGERQFGTFDFAWDGIAAIPGMAPGLSLGVQDAADRTEDGRRYYFVSTFREPLQVIDATVNADITVGVQTGRLTSPFVGFKLPFSRQFFLIAEHNGYRISAGIEFKIANNAYLRYEVKGNRTLFTVSVGSYRF